MAERVLKLFPVYPLIFTLFFALEILLISGFESLGLTSASYFTHGVALVVLIFLLRHFKMFSSACTKPIVPIVFLFQIGIIITGLTCEHITSLLGSRELIYLYFDTMEPVDLFLVVSSLALLVYTLFIIRIPHTPTLRWLQLSLFFTALRQYTSAILSNINQFVFLYSGIADLILIFCWLNLVYTLIDREYNA